MIASPLHSTASRYRRLSLCLLVLALVISVFADIEISRVSPLQELGRMAKGLLLPDFSATEYLALAIGQTISFALLGLALGVVAGGLLALCMDKPLVRGICALLRAVHELFWALIFLQLFGFSPLTGILAIAVPYSAIFARVYHDILAQAAPEPQLALPAGCGRLSAFIYCQLSQCWSPLVSYTRYRFECALRSATVLGFVGLPTLGFHLESAFKEGHYHQAGALLLLFYALIASIRWWLRAPLLPLYLLAALWMLPAGDLLPWQYLWRFLSEDIIPSPLRDSGVQALSFDGGRLLLEWLGPLWRQQLWPGLQATLSLSVIALAACAVLALLCYPLGSRRLAGHAYWPGHGLLIVLRSTPEMILTFVFLLIFGPSMLPAILALGIHNGALIGYLLARNADELTLRSDAATGFNLYFYELQPRLYRGFLAFLFYRFEVIMRESAILGILGVATLGFYIDSAFEDLRYDIAMLLIIITALLNMSADMLSTRLRRYITPQRLHTCSL